MKAFEMQTAEGLISMTEENHGIALYRDPWHDYSYLDYCHPQTQEEIAAELPPNHSLFFSRRELFLWMSNLAITSEDQKTLHLANREGGSFRSHHGWNSRVFLEDEPSDREKEFYAMSLEEDIVEELTVDWILEHKGEDE